MAGLSARHGGTGAASYGTAAIGPEGNTEDTSGVLFRPNINGSTTGGGHLSYDAAHHRWTGYCEQAGVEIGIHQLRRAHATELINNGVSIEADAVLGLTARIPALRRLCHRRGRPRARAVRRPPPLVRIFAVDLVHELVRTT
jgi:hypothetical protein